MGRASGSQCERTQAPGWAAAGSTMGTWPPTEYPRTMTVPLSLSERRPLPVAVYLVAVECVGAVRVHSRVGRPGHLL